MLARLAWLEIAQQLRSPVPRIVAAISLLMVVGSALIDALRLDALSRFGSGSELVMRVHLIWCLFYLFTAAALVGEAVTRDEQTGFAPLVRATPVRRAPYLLGRFVGASLAVMLCFLSVPIGLITARLVPGADPAWAATAPLSTYAIALLAIAIPNLLLASALFLALSTAARSMSGCLIGAVALLGLYGLGNDLPVSPTIEPFGVVATDALLAGNPVPLIGNRLIWLAIAGLLIILALWLDGRTPAGSQSTKRRYPSADTSTRPMAYGSPPFRPSHGLHTALSQVGMRVRHHVRQSVQTPVFLVLLLLGCASSLAALWPEIGAGATPERLIETQIRSFQLVPVVIALFFAGEIHWADHEHRTQPLIGSSPVATPILRLAEIASLSFILFVVALATGASVFLILAASGEGRAPVLVLTAYVLPKTYDWVLLAVLACFLQSLSPNKFAGWGLFVLFLIATLGLDQAGLSDPIIHYGRYPGSPLPPVLTGETETQAYRLLWGAVALVLAAVTIARPAPSRRK